MTRKLKIISLIILGVLLAAIAVTYGTAIPGQQQQKGSIYHTEYHRSYEVERRRMVEKVMRALCGNWSGTFWTMKNLNNSLQLVIWMNDGILYGKYADANQKSGAIQFNVNIHQIDLNLLEGYSNHKDLLHCFIDRDSLYFQLNPGMYYYTGMGWGAGQLTRQK